MDEEYFLNGAELVHDSIAVICCYYMVIHYLRSGIYLAESCHDDERR